MGRFRLTSASLISHGTRHQFAIGIALIAVIPPLLLFHLMSESFQSPEGIAALPAWGRLVVVLVILMALAFLGYRILRKYPDNMLKLERYTARMAEGELPDEIVLDEDETDIVAVKRHMILIIDRLKRKIEDIEVEKAILEKQLLQARKMESLRVVAGGIGKDLDALFVCMQADVDALLNELPASSPRIWELLGQLDQETKQAAEVANQMLMCTGGGKANVASLDLSAAVASIRPLQKFFLKETAEVNTSCPPASLRSRPMRCKSSRWASTWCPMPPRRAAAGW